MTASFRVPKRKEPYMRYWTQKEMVLLENAESFPQIVYLALIVLQRMKAENEFITEICGPMTTGGLGSREKNMELFSYAIEEAERHNVVVFNQIPFQKAIIRITGWMAEGGYRADILEGFYKPIFESELVSELMFLPDWETSTGASWERLHGKLLGIKISEYPKHWLAPFFEKANTIL